ncbi:DUF819 family protein [Nafulsella turpanensis]|uniref:DUF819 family protein n=1 Tax=Nafulsella turpanensis TaxID=1265690 RepID=UPI00034CA3FD|nr:DUF819 family protein [Nafulsella turpanensis]
MEEAIEQEALLTNDAVIFGILMIILALVFYTASSESSFWKKFYSVIPSLLLCYFIPSLLNTFNIVDGESSQLYFVASRYLLPAALVLLTISVDFKGILRLGPKAIIMFLAGTVGIVLGGPIAMYVVSLFDPAIVAGDEVWRGLSTIAGSWIGGGANQAAMLEVFGADPDIFSTMVTVDVIVANIWMAVLLFGAGRSKKVDKLFNADASAIEDVKKRIESYRLSVAQMPTLTLTMIVLGIGFGVTGVSHLLADLITPVLSDMATVVDEETGVRPYKWLNEFSLTSNFFWLVVIATTVGLALSFTRARRLEGVGASRLGSVFIYILVATIGMQMDITSIADNPGMFAVGLVWMLVHVTVLLSVGKLIKAPFFFTAVGSQANVGGAASAPIVASAFHDSLAPVGVLLAVLGYALGTYAAYICGLLMQWMAGVIG